MEVEIQFNGKTMRVVSNNAKLAIMHLITKCLSQEELDKAIEGGGIVMKEVKND